MSDNTILQSSNARRIKMLKSLHRSVQYIFFDIVYWWDLYVPRLFLV